MNQSRVIDVSRQPARDQAPMIRFRRTDQDRRPARVVLRPNDGPGSWERRQELSRQRLAEAARKTIVIEGKPMSSVEKARAQRWSYKLAILTKLADAPMGLPLRDVAAAISVNYDMTSKLASELSGEGLVERVIQGRAGGGRSSNALITEAGLALLDANP